MYVPALPVQVRTGDTAEYQAVPWILGIAHPTGFPVYTLTGWIFSHVLLPFGTVAWRINALSALCTALTVAAVVLLAEALEAGSIAAFAAGMAFAFGTVVWHGAEFATPHTLSGLLIVMTLLASTVFARNGDRRALILACGCAGFGLATQPETIWVLPALAVAALWQRHNLRPRLVAWCIVLLVVPLAFYAYVPIRSTIVAATHQDPNAVAPLFGAGGVDWDENHPRTLDGFLEEVLGTRAGADRAVARSFDPRRFSSAAGLWIQHAREQFSDAFLVLAALGIVALALRDRRSLSVIVAGTAGGLLFAYAYRYDIELYRYFLVASAATAALAAASTRLTVPRVTPTIVAVAATVALVVLAGETWQSNRGIVAETSYGGSQALIDAVRHDLPDGAIVVAAWYDATTLMYGAAVEHTLGARLIVKGVPREFVGQFRDWTRMRRVFIYANRGIAQFVTTEVPADWVHERPSSLGDYHIFEIVPTATDPLY